RSYIVEIDVQLPPDYTKKVFNLKTAVDPYWSWTVAENFRFKPGHGGQKVLTKELPDRLGFQLLRSYFESSQQPMDTSQQRFHFVRLDTLRTMVRCCAPP